MERNSTYLYQSSIKEFRDISNFNPNMTNPDAFKESLKNSYVEEFNGQPKSARSSTSREKNCIKGIARYPRNNRITELKLDIPQQYAERQATGRKEYSGSKTPRNVPSFPDQTYQPFQESNSFTPKKQTEPIYNRSIKIPNVGYPAESPYFGQNTQKQNKPVGLPRRFKDQKSTDKDKINFRDSLGSLSKQIKNTLKMTIQNQDSDTLGYKEKQNIENKNITTHRRSKAGSIKGDEEDLYPKPERISSFFTNGSLNRLKRPKHLDLKLNMDFMNDKQNIQRKQKNVYEQNDKIADKYPIKAASTDRNFLGKSTVVSTAYQNDNFLKYSSVVEPLTPQMKGGNKQNFYNYEKQKPKAPFFSSSTPQKPETTVKYTHTKTSSNLSNFSSTKTSALMSSSVTESSCQFGKERDSLSSRGRSSLGHEITLNDFHVGSVKGEGRFGKFYPAIHKKTGMLVGIKEIKKQSLKHMLDQFIQQLKIQTYIDHPNIVKLYGYFCTKQNFYLILEYMEEGSLFSFIKKLRKLPEQQASTKLKQICSAVEYLHENEILHRDIKPENIVMTLDVCKLCDFGWAVYSSVRRKTYCGTLDYVCPQILEGDSYDTCVDIWAIGVLAYEMIVGKAPFYNISRKQTMNKIMHCNFQIPKQLSSKAKDFVLKALNKNPQYRESLQALGKHEFLN